jgi:hypothetical protein
MDMLILEWGQQRRAILLCWLATTSPTLSGLYGTIEMLSYNCTLSAVASLHHLSQHRVLYESLYHNREQTRAFYRTPKLEENRKKTRLLRR